MFKYLLTMMLTFVIGISTVALPQLIIVIARADRPLN